MEKIMSVATFLTKAAVIGIMAKFASGSVQDAILGVMDGAAVNAAHAQMKLMHGKLMEHYYAYNRYPQTIVEFRKLFESEFDTPFEKVITDPWKKKYVFLTNAVEILCFGPDQSRGTKDDIVTQYPNNVIRPVIR